MNRRTAYLLLGLFVLSLLEVIIAVRAVPFGQPISADDLGTIELPLHRPAHLAGIGDANAIIGKWAAREIGPGRWVQV